MLALRNLRLTALLQSAPHLHPHHQVHRQVVAQTPQSPQYPCISESDSGSYGGDGDLHYAPSWEI